MNETWINPFESAVSWVDSSNVYGVHMKNARVIFSHLPISIYAQIYQKLFAANSLGSNEKTIVEKGHEW